MLFVGGKEVPLDPRGYLLDRTSWSPAMAIEMARQDGISLDSAHWEIINFMRGYYESYALAPPMRLLVREIARQFGPDKGSSRYLYRLFPDGPAKQACRYAGLPKPVSCI